MRVLITGGGGMLGRNLHEILSDMGFHVDAPRRAELDCLSLSKIKKYLEEYPADIVINCAGKVGSITDNMQYPDEYFYDNAQIGINVLRASHEVGIEKVLNIGTINSLPIFGNDETVSEDDLLSGSLTQEIEPYGIAKAVVARYAKYISFTHGMHYKTLHLSNLFGRYDNFGNKAHMIPAIIARLHQAKVSGLPSVGIWGDGTAKRSFIFANDVATFIGSVLSDFEAFPQDYLLEGASSYTVYEYNKMIASVVGYQGVFELDLAKPVGNKKRKLASKHKGLYKIEYMPMKESINIVYNYFLKKRLYEK